MQTKTATPEFTRQRRAVYHGLCQVLSEEEAIAALELWTDRFSESGSAFSGMNNYVREVCTSYNKLPLQRDLVKAINKALMVKEDELIPAPDYFGGKSVAQPKTSSVSSGAVIPKTSAPLLSTATDAFSQTVVSTPEFQTFQVLLLAIIEQINEYRADLDASFREFVKDTVNHMHWSEAQQNQVIMLVDSGATTQTRAYRPGQLKVLMNHLTLWLEENIGNILSARVINQAVESTAKSSVSAQYGPDLFM